MRTRRQTKIQAESTSSSPLQKKDELVRGHKKDEDNVKDDKKPNKRVKKDIPPASPPPSPRNQRAKRGRKKKQQRVVDKSEEKKKSSGKEKQNQENKRNSQVKKKQKQEKQRKSEAKDKKDKDNKKDKDQKQKSQEKEEKKEKKIKKQISPSPEKRKSKSPQKQQIKKVIVKGAAPVDQYFDRGKDFHVLVHNNKVYSATLNQTNISNNNNKYYNLQIIQSDKNPNINYFMTRWGRVGTPGQKSIVGPVSINVAISEYSSKFYQKHKKGQYRELQMNYGDDQEQKKDQSNQNADQTNNNKNENPMADYQESKLPKQTKDLINLIFDLGMMNKQMKQIGYNVNKMPLGKLSKDNIKLGYSILKKLYDQIENKKRESVMQQLTNDFYSYIPHDVGFRNMRLYKLDTLKKVKQKLQMLQSLTEIKIATEILKDKDQGNRIDNNYKKLNRDIKVIQKDSFTYKLINDYLQTTHASTHGAYDLELVDLFQLDSQTERNRFTNDIPNKMLLWHGSRLTNFVGILSQGLRIAPPQAPVTGYMFGKGVYFADMSSKSANYCFTNPENNTGILILCQVALGECNEKMHADYLASNLPDGKHSTKGVGKTAPKKQNFITLDGVTIPMGPGCPTQITGCSLLYNEFIVYKIEQIKIKYLLRTKFNYKRAHGY